MENRRRRAKVYTCRCENGRPLLSDACSGTRNDKLKSMGIDRHESFGFAAQDKWLASHFKMRCGPEEEEKKRNYRDYYLGAGRRSLKGLLHTI